MKTNKRIRDLARNTLEGHRGAAHQEFRTIVAANGYQMARGGYVTFGGEPVCRGWDTLSYMVAETQEIVLREPAEAEETAREDESRAYIVPDETEAAMERAADAEEELETADAILEVRAILEAEVPQDSVEITYYYTTRVPFVPLTRRTSVTTLITEEATSVREGACESGAALACSGKGFLRILPESMLPGQERTRLIQCTECYDASADAYVRKLHHYADPR